MVAYNFQKQFADDVGTGRKRQAIRAGEPRCKVDDRLQLYTDMRPKACRKLLDAVCTEVRPIAIIYAYDQIGGYHIILDGRRLVFWPDGGRLTRADGFKDAFEMCRWFEKTHGLPFNGYVVNW